MNRIGMVRFVGYKCGQSVVTKAMVSSQTTEVADTGPDSQQDDSQ